jgi:hypothetical protein
MIGVPLSCASSLIARAASMPVHVQVHEDHVGKHFRRALHCQCRARGFEDRMAVRTQQT